MANLDINTIIPVAPRDLGFLPACIGHLEASLADLADSRQLSKNFTGWMLRIVVDGPVRASELEPVYDRLRAMKIDFLSAWQVHGLDRPHGPGIARNYALAQCQGEDFPKQPELVTFMDADDVPMPWWLRTLVGPVIAHMGRDDAGVPFVYCPGVSEQYDDKNKRTVRWSFPPVPVEQIHRALEHSNVMLTTAVCTAPQVLQRAGGFEPHLICGEDGNLWRRAAFLMVDETTVVKHYSVDLPVVYYKPRKDGQSRGLHSFSEKAFHLDKDIYGPMGQKLDDKAMERSKAFYKAETIGDRIAALCGDEVKGALWRAS